MITNVKRFESSEGNVWKYVFHLNNAVAEAVLYRYNSFDDRTVICCSVQSGCPVGCTFCGTGNKFIRNLSASEIVEQIQHILKDMHIENVNSTCSKFQIMFMSMGEPFLNYYHVKEAIIRLHKFFPNAQLLVSTIAPKQEEALCDFIQLSKDIPKIGLQFSIHNFHDEVRNNIIPYENKLSLTELRNYGVQWWFETRRKPYLNYCMDECLNFHDVLTCQTLFPANIFCMTFSVVCSPDENMKLAGNRSLARIRNIEAIFSELGYDTRVFDPAGQDDIGGGCGQLWYVQRYLKGDEDEKN